MPNWSENMIAFKGSEENVLKMLNAGLRNSGADECATLDEALSSLDENAKHKAVEGGKIVLEEDLSLRTFLPIPDTFLLHDTTNRPNNFPDAVREQSETYNVVGWYDYNLKTLGTKWDAVLEITDIEVGADTTIVFYCETAWSYPDAWIVSMEQEFGLKAYILTKEEGGFYYFYGTPQEQVDVLPKVEELYHKHINEENEEDGCAWDLYRTALAELWEECETEFREYIRNN